MRAWFSEPEHMILALGVALLLVGIGRLPRVLAWAGQLRLLGLVGGARGRAGVAPAPASPPPAGARPHLTVPGGGEALAQPPGVPESLAYMRRASPHDRYLLPLGWRRNRAGDPDLVHTALVGETNHLLISGASDSGKDNLAWWMLLSLALAQPDPQRLQVAILDGKGLDFQPWAAKAQTWRLATESEQIPAAMRALTAERQRRKGILAAAGVSKWDQYAGPGLPLLVVFISELSLLETAVRRERQRRDRDRSQDLDLEVWLNDELSSGRAFGIRYLIGMQTVTGMDMLWRSQIGVFLAGYQPDETQVKPNTTRTARQIVEAGAVPPHQLPAPPAGAGVFTIVSGAQCVTARAPYLPDAERRRWLARLPDRAVAPAPPSATPVDAAGAAALLQRLVAEPPAPEPAAPPPPAAPQPTTEAALALSPADIAAIGARIAAGATKTAVVRAMPGYDTRRHREFAAYYDMLYTQLAEWGLIEIRARG